MVLAGKYHPLTELLFPAPTVSQDPHPNHRPTYQSPSSTLPSTPQLVRSMSGTLRFYLEGQLVYELQGVDLQLSSLPLQCAGSVSKSFPTGWGGGGASLAVSQRKAGQNNAGVGEWDITTRVAPRKNVDSPSWCMLSAFCRVHFGGRGSRRIHLWKFDFQLCRGSSPGFCFFLSHHQGYVEM